jgi:hypothetical protein
MPARRIVCHAGRVSAPRALHRLHRMRRPASGTKTPSESWLGSTSTSRRQERQVAISAAQPSARMLPKVIAGPEYRMSLI